MQPLQQSLQLHIQHLPHRLSSNLWEQTGSNLTVHLFVEIFLRFAMTWPEFTFRVTRIGSRGAIVTAIFHIEHLYSGTIRELD